MHVPLHRFIVQIKFKLLNWLASIDERVFFWQWQPALNLLFLLDPETGLQTLRTLFLLLLLLSVLRLFHFITDRRKTSLVTLSTIAP